MDANSKFYNFCMTVTDLIMINVLFFVCSIPVFTIGASFTALYDCTLKMVRGEETSPIYKGFFKAFRQNFKQATLIWILLFAVGAFLVWDFYIITGTSGASSQSMGIVLLAVLAFIYIMLLAYLFPMMARYENTTRALMQNSIRLAVGRFPYTITIMVMDISPLLILLVPGDYIKWIIMAYIFIWFSLVAWINSRLFRVMFDRLEGVEPPKQENKTRGVR